MLDAKGRQTVWALLACLVVFSWLMAWHLEPRHLEYVQAQGHVSSVEEQNSKSEGALGKTPFQALIPVLLGFREVLASLMWVQADDLFHRGEYRPILSLVKQIALIDPHNLDVYATGAWHMAYNFMDRRLVRDGVEFLEQGVQNNPHVYDLFFELGYMHYDKTKDYASAAHWYDLARAKPTTTGKPHAPLYVWSAHSHALERMGDVDAAIASWKENLKLAEDEVAVDPKNYIPNITLAAARHNLYMTQRRLNEREATWLEWQGRKAEALDYWKKNVALADEYLKVEPGRTDIREQDLPAATASVARVESGDLHHGKPRDLHFDFTWKKTGPRRIRVTGTVDLITNARVTVILRDVDYDQRAARGLDYKMANATLWQDTMVHVGSGKFTVELKMDQDPADMGRTPEQVYPLKSDRYELTVIFNPRQQSNEVQDRTGWNGEGMTNSVAESVREDPNQAGTVLGQKRPLRTLQKSVIVQRSDIV